MTTATTSHATVPAPLPLLEQDSREFGRRLREETIAVRVRKWKFGTSKALTKEQKAPLTQAYHADVKAVRASKKLVDTSQPALRRVTSILSNVIKYWKSVTAPYPELGIRLIKRSRIKEFEQQMQVYKNALEEALIDLQASYELIRTRARHDLGDLFNAADYPSRLDNEYAIDWDFPAIGPPEYLKQVHPQLYAAEQAKHQARFEEAVRMAESAFVDQFRELVARLGDSLRGEVDGKPKVVRSANVDNMRAFFEQFRSLDIGSNSALSDLVGQAEQLLEGRDVQVLRDDTELRDQIGGSLSQIQQVLDAMVVDNDMRAITLDDGEDGDEDNDNDQDNDPDTAASQDPAAEPVLEGGAA